MADRFRGVLGAHEGLEKTDLQGGTDGQLVEALQQFLDFGALAEVAAGHIVAQDLLAVFLEALGVGFFVNAMDGGASALDELDGHRFVGQQHVFLDELVGDIVLDLLDAGDPAGFVQPDLALREIEGQGAVFEPVAADDLGQLVSLVQHPLEGIRRRALEDGKGFPIGEPPTRVNDRRVEPGAQHGAVGPDQKLDALGEPVDLGFKRAELVAERFRQHGNHAIDQVSRIAAPLRFLVQGGAGFHIVRHIGDMNPEPPLVGVGAFQANRIIKILGVVRVDGDDLLRPAIGAPVDFRGRDLVAKAAGFLQRRLGKLQGQVVVAEHRQHIDPFGIGRTEHLDDFAFGIGMARLPFAQFDHHFIADAGGPADVTRGWHINIMRDAGIVRNDEKELSALLQRAHDLRAAPFENANDRAGVFIAIGSAQPRGRTSRRTRTRSSCRAVEVAFSGIRSSFNPGSSGWR